LAAGVVTAIMSDTHLDEAIRASKAQSDWCTRSKFHWHCKLKKLIETKITILLQRKF